jgi:mycothiol synthase
VIPESTTQLTWRPATLDDLDAITTLTQAMAGVDHPNYIETREEIESELTHSWTDLATDTLVAVQASGVLAAFGLVIFPPRPDDLSDTFLRAIIIGGVHPDLRGRGIGRTLLTWQHARGLEQLASSDAAMPGWLMAYCDERSPSHAALLERFDFATSRYFIQLERVLAEPIPELALPVGVRFEVYTPEWSERIWKAKNASFADHWGSQPGSLELWQSSEDLPTRRNDLSFAAVAGDEVVGLLVTSVNEEDWVAQGFTGAYIELVGVVREWRKKGIAPALLARAFRAFREQGFERAVLDVDAESPTGALGLYTGMGFTETTKTIAYTRVF